MQANGVDGLLFCICRISFGPYNPHLLNRITIDDHPTMVYRTSMPIAALSTLNYQSNFLLYRGCFNQFIIVSGHLSEDVLLIVSSPDIRK
jgi:hypothetical protein